MLHPNALFGFYLLVVASIAGIPQVMATYLYSLRPSSHLLPSVSYVSGSKFPSSYKDTSHWI